MKTKLLLILGMVLLFVARGVGQCPVVSYSIEDVPKEYLSKGGSSFNKGIKILMKDTLKYYRHQIEYFSDEDQKLHNQKFVNRKYKIDLPGFPWYSHVYDSSDSFHATLVDLRYSWIPLDEEILAKSDFVKIKVSTYRNHEYWDWSLIDTLCDITIRTTPILSVGSNKTVDHIVFANNKKILIMSEDLNFAVDEIYMIDFSGKATLMKFEESSSNTYLVDAHSLSSGVFFLQALLKNGKVIHRKILIN